MNISDLFGVDLLPKPSSKIPSLKESKTRVIRSQAPSREELFELGKTLSAEHKIKTGFSNDRRLYLRLQNNCSEIEKSYFQLAETAKKKEAITPGAEWLLDNYFVIEKQIYEIRNFFPRGYDRVLPRLLEGEYRQYPRVFHLILTYIANSDCALDIGLLNAFIDGYQTHAVLHISEVWAVPIMIRFALLDQLRELSIRMIQAKEELKAAENLVEEILGDESKPGTQILLNLAEKVMVRPDFLALGAGHLIRRLRDRGRKAALTLQWLEERLREEGRDPEEILKTEQRNLSADQITIGNIFTSLRSIGHVNWDEWFELNCKVEHILKLDPAGIYPKCDFKTRDTYRQRLEKLARYAKKPETEVAVTAINLARDFLSSHPEKHRDFRSSVGGYLSQRGLPLLENAIGHSPGMPLRIKRVIKRYPFLFYISAIALLTVFPLLYVFTYATTTSIYSWQIFLALLISFIPASDLGLNITQWLVTRFTSPKLLPKFDFEKGIPEEFKTVVVVHSLFTDRTTAKNTIEGLHVRYLSNDDPNLTFCILADLADSPTEVAEKDDIIVSYAKTKIAELCKSYGHKRFIVLFRKRMWNPKENCFMAWERKRGKIEEFNRLLSGATDTSFVITPEEREQLVGHKLVITLDNDTQLPRGMAQKLVGAAAHPTNYPIVDPQSKRVIEGYTIIQPRVGVSLTSANTSLFARIFSGHAGLDPYTQSVSDVYQDLFNEGSYIGKGIYHVHAFEEALHNRVPENALLSHDLFEGVFTRVALASDIELYDDFPSKYNAHAKRQHRWIRGDWQLLPWVGIRNPAREGKAPSRITALGRWKLFDNLRRSLVAPSLFLLLTCGSVFLPGNPLVWTLLGLIVIAFPVFTNLAQALIIPPHGMSFESHIGGVWKDFSKMFKQTMLTLTFMPHQAYLCVHAILITLYRLYISKRNLLQWETAYHAERKASSSLGGFISAMFGGLVITAAGFYFVIMYAPERLPLVMPLYILWFSAPFIAHEVSKPRHKINVELSVDQKNKVRTYALQTWSYFAKFLTPENNYLIPDNFQEVPHPVVAQRTSPTNVSLSMLTVISAYDLGFISAPKTIEIVSRIFDGLEKLERYAGHFLNWYRTDTAESLYPRYVSMVDSGNMVGHLIALRASLRDIKRIPLITRNHLEYLNQHDNAFRGKLSDLHSSEELTIRQALWAFDTLIASQHIDIHDNQILQTLSSLAWMKEIDALLQRETSENSAAVPSIQAVATSLNELTFTSENLRRITESVRGILISLNRSNESTEILRNGVSQTEQMVQHFMSSCHSVFVRATNIIDTIDFKFLYDDSKDLFAIGYNVDAARRDTSYYDLLASEARLGSLCAIALGQLPQRHWFSLGRGLTEVPGGKALLSWTGTMFEYLMPLLVMRSYPGTLLHETYDVVVKAQRTYGASKGTPWGISESSYSGVDFERTYQYRAFGVPGLGLKRGLEEDLVISPYSTMMALPVAPVESLDNLIAMEKLGFLGEFGFYEAVDYTKSRLAPNEPFHIVQSYFAHHQGMSVVAMTNLLTGGIWQERFHKDPIIQSVDLVLQERFPERLPVILPHQTAAADSQERINDETAIAQKMYLTPHTQYPRTHLLSNGRYTVMVDNSGSGYSVFDKEMSLTRWKEDLVQNDMGTHIFMRDLDTNKVWSSGFQPVLAEPEFYEAIFSPDKAEFKRRDYGIFSHQEITVSPEENVEIRKLTLANTGSEKRTIEITTFAEVALAPIRADQAHPAFAKMFIQSEYLDEFDALLFSRRPRSKHEEVIYMMHQVIMKTVWDRTRYESSREAFIGRGRSIRSPQVLEKGAQLAGNSGYVLDPCMSLRVKIELNPGESQHVTFTTAFSTSKEDLIHTATRYRDTNQIHRAFEIAWSQASIELRNEQAFGKHALTFQQLANCLILNVEKVRASSDIIARNRLGQSALWRFGISGDLPICLVRITEQNQTKIVEELLQAHHYLRNRGFQFDLVIFNEHLGGYLQQAQEEIEFLIKSSFSAPMLDKKGGIFVRNISQLSEEEKDLMQSVARVVLSGLRGSLASQLKIDEQPLSWTPYTRKRTPHFLSTEAIATKSKEGEFFNGVGSFNEDGKAYSFRINDKALPPAPWSNVIANPSFGTLVTECGGGYTWSQNSRENRITPWSNDPVSDPLGEVIYIRDAKTGSFWCPTPRPIALESDVIVHHRFGETEFVTTVEAITSTLSISVDDTDSVKFWNLHLTNHSPTPRTLELYLYANWVLGVQRQDTYTQIVSAYDKEHQILYAQNKYNADFGNRIVFLGSSMDIDGYTTSRAEFIGRNRDVSSPVILADLTSGEKGLSKTLSKLSGKTGGGFDSCAVIKVVATVEGNSSTLVSFFMGDAPSVDAMFSQAASYKRHNAAHDSIKQTKALYEQAIDAVQVKTPERSFDIMINGWLLYQTLSCRLWGRTGFYQSGGAYGFRDQLQDSASLIYSRPDLVRAQILLHASRQFPEGDVQHWWHPPTGKGVRTKISDDYLWLPLITNKYIQVTGDDAILEERAGFIDGPILPEHEMEAYIVPTLNPHTSTLYEKCLLMLDRSLVWGVHGLPLIGGGDWNDGMNEIGRLGKGESVWMGWFLATVLKNFIPIVRQKGDTQRVERYQNAIDHLIKSLQENSWDGEWYRRAYFDDGSPVGSIGNEECKIDSLPQSWSIISGLGDNERSKIAMDNVYKYLVSKEHKIIKLFTPPFNTGPQEPGYIKGYLPGVRENGGQYTHASAWVIIATALMGDGAHAVDLFNLINPVLHTNTTEGAAKYRCEPYVLCGDVYSAAPHEGRAGWSWYTGSAGWMYQAGVEHIMGLKVFGDHFTVAPCIPKDWKSCSMSFKWKDAHFEIEIQNTNGQGRNVSSMSIDGKTLADLKVSTSDAVAGKVHQVKVVL